MARYATCGIDGSIVRRLPSCARPPGAVILLPYRHHFVTLGLIALGFPAGLGAADAPSGLFDQASHDSTGFGMDAARIDSQITLAIPAGKAAEVYAYLRATYAESNTKLKEAFPALDLKGDQQVDVSNFTDRYFDTPDLELYASGSTIRFRTRVNTTNPEDRKSGRQLVQMKVTPDGRFDLRTELKFEVKPSRKFRDGDDASPLLRLVDRLQRSDLKSAIRRIGIDPYRLQEVVTIQQTRKRVYLYLAGENFLSFSVDEFKSGILWSTARASSVDIGLVENAYTQADAARRADLWRIREFLVQDLKERFPGLKVNDTEKYSLIMAQLLDDVPSMRFLVRHRLL